MWSIQTEDDIDATPVIANGKVYVLSYAKIFCLDVETGEELWNKSSGGNLGSSPVYVDGKIYYGSWFGIYCRDAEDGDLIWHFDNYEFIKSSPVVAEGRLYVSSYIDELLICLDAEGDPETQTTSELWSFSTTGETAERSSPTFADDRLYFSTLNTFYCLDTNDNGSVIWYHPIQHGENENICPSYAYDYVYIGARYGEDGETLYCLDAIGNENGTTDVIWTFTEGFPYFLAGIVDEKVYVCSGGDMTTTGIYCLDAYGNGDGTTDLIWFWDAVDSFPTQAVIIGDEKVYANFWNSPMENRINSFMYCIGENEGPEQPDQPTGQIQGVVDVNYTYITNEVIDPDGDNVSYCWDFNGDLEEDICTDEPVVSYLWEVDNIYEIRVKARDIYGAESDWSEPLVVTIADLLIKQIKGGFGISVIVENVGETDVSDVAWSIMFDGGLILFPPGGIKEGTITDLLAGTEETFKTFVFGIGKTTIIINVAGLDKTTEGFVLGPFVFLT